MLAHLEVVPAGDLLELGQIGRELGQLDVHGGAYGRAEIARAEGQIAEALVPGELELALELAEGLDEPPVDRDEVAALLHRDQPQVVLLVAPGQQGLGVVVVNTAAWAGKMYNGRLQVVCAMILDFARFRDIWKLQHCRCKAETILLELVIESMRYRRSIRGASCTLSKSTVYTHVVDGNILHPYLHKSFFISAIIHMNTLMIRVRARMLYPLCMISIWTCIIYASVNWI